MAMIVENEKTFEHYLDLSPKLRMAILDVMEPIDRCRFTRCSKLSSKEAKDSKNYMHSLEIAGDSEDNLLIYVFHDDMDEDFNRPGFVMRFQEENRTKLKRCVNSNYEELWREELDISTDLVSLAGDYFKKLLNLYQRKIKRVSFEGKVLKDYDFEIDSMDRLESLSIGGDWDVQGYFSKIHHSLRSLFVKRGGDREAIAKCDQTYQVTDYIFMMSYTLNYEQMLRLSASSVIIHVGSLTAKDIFKIIRSWQNGTIRIKDIWYQWNLMGSNFDIYKLLRLLRVKGGIEGRISMTFEIKHYKKMGKSAELKYFNSDIQRELIFDTKKVEEDDW